MDRSLNSTMNFRIRQSGLVFYPEELINGRWVPIFAGWGDGGNYHSLRDAYACIDRQLAKKDKPIEVIHPYP